MFLNYGKTSVSAYVGVFRIMKVILQENVD